MKQTQIFSTILCAAATMMLWSGVVMSADWPMQGTTPYVTHFLIRPLTTIDVGGLGKAVALEFVGRTANMKGEKLYDKMAAHCVAVNVVSGPKNFIDGACVLTDKDGDQIFSSFNTWEIDKSQPKLDCGTHTITGGTGKYTGLTGKEPFNCLPLATGAGEGGWSAMDIEHNVTYKFIK